MMNVIGRATQKYHALSIIPTLRHMDVASIVATRSREVLDELHNFSRHSPILIGDRIGVYERTWAYPIRSPETLMLTSEKLLECCQTMDKPTLRKELSIPDGVPTPSNPTLDLCIAEIERRWSATPQKPKHLTLNAPFCHDDMFKELWKISSRHYSLKGSYVDGVALDVENPAKCTISSVLLKMKGCSTNYDPKAIFDTKQQRLFREIEIALDEGINPTKEKPYFPYFDILRLIELGFFPDMPQAQIDEYVKVKNALNDFESILAGLSIILKKHKGSSLWSTEDIRNVQVALIKFNTLCSEIDPSFKPLNFEEKDIDKAFVEGFLIVVRGISDNLIKNELPKKHEALIKSCNTYIGSLKTDEKSKIKTKLEALKDDLDKSHALFFKHTDPQVCAYLKTIQESLISHPRGLLIKALVELYLLKFPEVAYPLPKDSKWHPMFAFRSSHLYQGFIDAQVKGSNIDKKRTDIALTLLSPVELLEYKNRMAIIKAIDDLKTKPEEFKSIKVILNILKAYKATIRKSPEYEDSFIVSECVARSYKMPSDNLNITAAHIDSLIELLNLEPSVLECLEKDLDTIVTDCCKFIQTKSTQITALLNAKNKHTLEPYCHVIDQLFPDKETSIIALDQICKFLSSEDMTNIKSTSKRSHELLVDDIVLYDRTISDLDDFIQSFPISKGLDITTYNTLKERLLGIIAKIETDIAIQERKTIKDLNPDAPLYLNLGTLFASANAIKVDLESLQTVNIKKLPFVNHPITTCIPRPGLLRSMPLETIRTHGFNRTLLQHVFNPYFSFTAIHAPKATSRAHVLRMETGKDPVINIFEVGYELEQFERKQWEPYHRKLKIFHINLKEEIKKERKQDLVPTGNETSVVVDTFLAPERITDIFKDYKPSQDKSLGADAEKKLYETISDFKFSKEELSNFIFEQLDAIDSFVGAGDEVIDSFGNLHVEEDGTKYIMMTREFFESAWRRFVKAKLTKQVESLEKQTSKIRIKACLIQLNALFNNDDTQLLNCIKNFNAYNLSKTADRETLYTNSIPAALDRTILEKYLNVFLEFFSKDRCNQFKHRPLTLDVLTWIRELDDEPHPCIEEFKRKVQEYRTSAYATPGLDGIDIDHIRDALANQIRDSKIADYIKKRNSSSSSDSDVSSDSTSSSRTLKNATKASPKVTSSIVEIKPDGHCLFRAFGFQLFKQIRSATTDQKTALIARLVAFQDAFSVLASSGSSLAGALPGLPAAIKYLTDLINKQETITDKLLTDFRIDRADDLILSLRVVACAQIFLNPELKEQIITDNRERFATPSAGAASASGGAGSSVETSDDDILRQYLTRMAGLNRDAWGGYDEIKALCQAFGVRCINLISPDELAIMNASEQESSPFCVGLAFNGRDHYNVLNWT